jgi:proteasome assembly chaperone (PAC2) family protein
MTRTDKPSEQHHGNTLLAAALRNVEERITHLFEVRADAEEVIRTKRAEIEQITAQLAEAEEAKKYLQRAIIDSDEATRYLKGDV